ncbi:hypothetical protein ACFXHA_43605 [Nocardia sp. NPDC059240]|uniref:hypothetical protein n=1 Tax=Nocardia sp. NPDC059240 TaxID=3346786 RepID=UPI0036C4288E
MKRGTTLECLCGAHLNEVDTDGGLALVCPDCGAAENWPEHLTESTNQRREEVA